MRLREREREHVGDLRVELLTGRSEAVAGLEIDAQQDRPIIESQRPRRLPLEQGAELHCAADRLSVAYRRYLRNRAITFVVC